MLRNFPKAVCAALLCLLSGSARASFSSADLTPVAIPDPAERDKVTKALLKFEASGSAGNLAALESLLPLFDSKVIETISASWGFYYADPLKYRACNAIRNHWYSTAFLETAMQKGSNLAALWALRILESQAGNSGYPDTRYVLRCDIKVMDEVNRSPEVTKLKEIHGIIDDEFLNRLVPTLKKLQDSSDERVRKAAREFIDFRRPLMEKEDFLSALRQPDEAAAAKAFAAESDKFGTDPGITNDIWEILLHAKNPELISQLTRYPFLFHLSAFSEEKQRFLESQFATRAANGAASNLEFALEGLALSRNPLAPQIIQALSASAIPEVRSRAKPFLEELQEDFK